MKIFKIIIAIFLFMTAFSLFIIGLAFLFDSEVETFTGVLFIGVGGLCTWGGVKLLKKANSAQIAKKEPPNDTSKPSVGTITIKTGKQVEEPSLEDIENARKELKLPKGDVFQIVYKDFQGNLTERNVELLKSFEKNKKQYVYAFCHTNLAVRTFRADRIIAMSYDNRRLNDVLGYINNVFTPPEGIDELVAQALDDQAQY